MNSTEKGSWLRYPCGQCNEEKEHSSPKGKVELKFCYEGHQLFCRPCRKTFPKCQRCKEHFCPKCQKRARYEIPLNPDAWVGWMCPDCRAKVEGE